MKTNLRKWTLRLCALLFVLSISLIGIVLNPTLLYANKTTFGNFTVYHQQKLDPAFESTLNAAIKLVEASELYDKNFKIDICLNDGSYYPGLIDKLLGPAFGIGFYNKAVILGNIHVKENYSEILSYKYNLIQLLAHEMIHCYQYNHLGLLKSNPVAGYPQWKWDGYNEFVARQNQDQLNLPMNIDRLTTSEEKNKDLWCVYFSDSTMASKEYYKWWLEMSYCMKIKGMKYEQVLDDTMSEERVSRDMMAWKKRKL